MRGSRWPLINFGRTMAVMLCHPTAGPRQCRCRSLDWRRAFPIHGSARRCGVRASHRLRQRGQLPACPSLRSKERICNPCGSRAGRAQIDRQVLKKNLAPSLAGGPSGLAVDSRRACAAQHQSWRHSSHRRQRLGNRIDYRVLLFTFGSSLFTGIVFGLAPDLWPFGAPI